MSMQPRGPVPFPPNGQPREPQIPSDPGWDMLISAFRIFLVAILAILGSLYVFRVRRQILDKEARESENPEELLEAVREAYFEGELDKEEYEKARARIRGEESPPTPARTSLNAAEPKNGAVEDSNPSPPSPSEP